MHVHAPPPPPPPSTTTQLNEAAPPAPIPELEWTISPRELERIRRQAGPHDDIVAWWDCPMCATPVLRRRRAGRHRVYCTNSCKQRAYRARRAEKRRVPPTVWTRPRPDRATTYDRSHAIREFRDVNTGRRDSTGRGITACGAFARMTVDRPHAFGHTRFVAAPEGDPERRRHTCVSCEQLLGVSPGGPSRGSRGTTR